MKTGMPGRWAVTTLLLAVALSAPASCPPEATTRDQLLALKAAGFGIGDDGSRQAMALALLDCLGDPDPVLRDGIAFEALTVWMRTGLLSVDTRAQVSEALLARLAGSDADGFAAPFAALVLAEVARTDRIEPWLDPVRRSDLALAAAAYLGSISDYRGFVDDEGWRHGVAHAADLVLQLAMNDRIKGSDLNAMRAALATQVAPTAGHAYIHGESMRLARAGFAIAGRDDFDAADWSQWLATVAAPTPLADWSVALASEAGLARRHNVSAFLNALYLLAREGGNADAEARLLPGLRAALRAMR